jgi:hypothetical protein
MLKNLMHKENRQRFSLAGLAVLYVAVFSLTALVNTARPHSASAAGQVTSRKITLNNSSPSATPVTYAVSFNPTGTTNIGGITVDFCANDPVVGDTSCTLPTNFTLGTAITTGGAPTGFSTSTGSWVTTSSQQCAAAASNFQVFKFTNATAQTPSGSGTAITFSITSPTNPSSNGSFYARIVTFDTKANADVNFCTSPTVRPASFTGQVDYGGIALSTTQNIAITAKVFETLSFCVYQTSCGTQAQLTLGDATTGALATSTAYTNINAKYTLATNAQTGVSVQMFGQTLCRAITLNFANCPTGASTNTIKAIGTPAQLVNGGSFGPGNEAFGMCVNAVSGTTAQAPYDDTGTGNNCTTGITTNTYAGTSKFGFIDTSAANGTNNASGSTVLSSSGAVASASSQFAFAANISAITDAGIYQANLNLVATGTF